MSRRPPSESSKRPDRSQVGPLGAILAVTCMVAAVAYLCVRFLAKSPEDMGLAPDGDASHQAAARPKPRRTRSEIVRTSRFITISAAFSLGLFAQIGLLAHLARPVDTSVLFDYSLGALVRSILSTAG